MLKTARTLFIGLVSVIALLGFSQSAYATHVTPTLVYGNPVCDGGVKIEPVASGTYGNIVIVKNGSYFDFSTTDGSTVSQVIVKGGPNANLYTYDPVVTSDTGLHAPINASNGRPYGLSHLCFSIGDKKFPDPKK